MEGEEIKRERRLRGLTQEDLAQRLEIDVTTVQRWEGGRTRPSIPALQKLRDMFSKKPGIDHPLLDFFLNLDLPVAILDEHAMYRRVNSRFVDHCGLGDRAEIIDAYCLDVSEIWDDEALLAFSLTPEELLYTDFKIVTIPEGSANTSSSSNRFHTIAALRQDEYSSLIVHMIEDGKSGSAATSLARLVSTTP